MSDTQRQSRIAYRCPHCTETVFGLLGRFALSADMLRLRCPCGEASLDIQVRKDKKLQLSVPCVFCKKNHTYVLSPDLVFDRDRFLLSCPYANMDIAFLGDADKVEEDAARTGEQLQRLLSDMEAQTLSDIQPQDMDPAEILPDAQIYDTVRFVVRELEAEGNIDCPCHSGAYDLRFTDGGIEVFCPACGASHTFAAQSASAAQDYVTLDRLLLH